MMVERMRGDGAVLAELGIGLPASNSAIVTANVPDADERLAAAGVRAATRAGSLRVSFHLYNTETEVDAAVAALVGDERSTSSSATRRL